MREGVHTCRIEPDEERFVGAGLPLNEVDRGGAGLVVDGFHALFGQCARILDGLLADPAETWILSGVVAVRRLAPQHAARTEPGPELRVLGIIGMLRLLLGVEVIEIAEELVEAVHGRQECIAVSEMIFTELAGGVAERFQSLGDRDV